jgi:hypothetical protein
MCDSSGDSINLPSSTDYTYQAGYNDEKCGTVGLYYGYMEDYCFALGTNSSVIFEWPYYYYYPTEYDCSGTQQKEKLSTQCIVDDDANSYYVEIYGFYAIEYSYTYGHSAASFTTGKPTTNPTNSPADSESLSIILTISGFSGDITDPDTQQAILLATRDVSGLDDSDSLEIIDTYRRRLFRVLSTDVTVEMAATVYLSDHPSFASISDVVASISLALSESAADGSLNAALINECTGTCGTSFNDASTSVSVVSADSNAASGSGSGTGISGGGIAAIVIFVLLAVSSIPAYFAYRCRKAAKDSSALKSFELSEGNINSTMQNPMQNPIHSSAVNSQRISVTAESGPYKTASK